MTYTLFNSSEFALIFVLIDWNSSLNYQRRLIKIIYQVERHAKIGIIHWPISDSLKGANKELILSQYPRFRDKYIKYTPAQVLSIVDTFFDVNG